MEVGLIETIRVREGRPPWLERHVARLRASCRALGLTEPPADIEDLARREVGSGDHVVRLELRDGHAELSTREVNRERAVALVVSEEPYHPYPHKTTGREQFERARAQARRAGGHDALLVTAEGYVAEGTSWSLFWWDHGGLCTPAEELGILPGIGRSRVMELKRVQEARVLVSALAGRSLFLVNAVRGIVEVGSLQGNTVPSDPRTSELSSIFWPD